MSTLHLQRTVSDFKVGLVTFIALFFLILGITFAGADKNLLFRQATTLQAELIDVGGLKVGAPVTIGGLTIGKVTDISFISTAKGTRINVTMQVRADIRSLIKTDSVPSVRTQGMMGDRYIDISMGTEEAAVLATGKPLIGASAAEFDETLKQTNVVLKEVEKLLKAVNEKQGTVGQFVYDSKFYNSLSETTEALKSLLKDFQANPKKYVKLSLF